MQISCYQIDRKLSKDILKIGDIVVNDILLEFKMERKSPSPSSPLKNKQTKKRNKSVEYRDKYYPLEQWRNHVAFIQIAREPF